MDTALVLRAQHGDRGAFGELAAAMGDHPYALAYRIIRDADAAQDATQEAIVHAWRDLPALREVERFEAWAYRILVRECYREARRRRSRGPQLYAVPDTPPST
jgi:RNA polymerase sigma-70 factor, ECF subfamily